MPMYSVFPYQIIPTFEPVQDGGIKDIVASGVLFLITCSEVSQLPLEDMQAAFENCPCGQLDYDVRNPGLLPTATWISILEADPLASIRPSDDWSKSWLHKHEGLSQSHIAISKSWPTEIVNIEIIHDSCYFRLVTRWIVVCYVETEKYILAVLHSLWTLMKWTWCLSVRRLTELCLGKDTYYIIYLFIGRNITITFPVYPDFSGTLG